MTWPFFFLSRVFDMRQYTRGALSIFSHYEKDQESEMNFIFENNSVYE